MRLRARLVASVPSVTWLALALVPALAHAARAQAVRQAEDPSLEVQRRLYDDPAEFEKLSSAMQNVLIAKFGPRAVLDAKGNPIAPAASGVLAPNQSPSGRMLSVLGNVLVNDPFADATAQDTQSETALVLASGGKLVAAFNDSGSFIGANRFTGWAYSNVGGGSWTDPGVLPGSNDAGDPVLARDSTTGRIYLACLFFTGSGINLFRSDDDGATWMPAVNCAPGAPSGSMDKEWIAVDDYPGPGNGNVYHIVRDFGSGNGIYFFRSLDQGTTWGPAAGTLIASGAGANVQGAYVVVMPNHDVHAFWFDSNFSPAQIRTRRSSDQGVTWSAPLTVTTLTSTATNGNLTLTAGFRSNSFVQACANPVSGNLYVVYNDPTAVSGGDRGNIFLRQSTDNGATWGAPILVNDDGTTRAQYFPAIACRPDGTGLAVGWYDNRNDPNDRLIERWSVTATISGSTITFGPNFRVSPQFVPVFGVDPVVNTVYMGDYDQMAADASNYYTTWGDNRDTSIAVPTRKNANVRFASFPPEGPGAILDFQSATVSGGNGNGFIDSNECNELNVLVKNNGSASATGCTAELSTSTPGVTVFTGSQSLPDLAPGANGGPVAPFQVATSALFDCSPIEFTLTVTHSGGTDVSSFTIAGSTDYTVMSGSDVLLGGTADIGNHGDDTTTTVALPFPVQYYANIFNQVTLSSNGNAQFSSASSAYSNECLPTATFTNAIVAQWDDLRTDGVGRGIFTRTLGSAPARTFVVEWRTTYFSGGGTANFELRLHEDTGDFELVYGSMSQNGSSATVGCQEGTGAHFTTWSCNTAGSVPNGLKLSFALPPCADGGGQCGPAPTLVSVSPDHGPNSGGTIVLTGADFTNASTVTLDAVSVPFVIDNDTQITVTYPATSTTGFVDVGVANGSGSSVLSGAFDYFAPPDELGRACHDPFLSWSGAPILGEDYTVTTENLGTATQVLLVDWSDNDLHNKVRRAVGPACEILISPDTVENLGTTPSFTFSIPNDLMLVGVRLRTQAVLSGPAATTQVLSAKIGE